LSGGDATRVLREVKSDAASPEPRLLIVDGRWTQYAPAAATPLFSINALPDRVTPRWPPPSLLLSLGSDIKASPFTGVSRFLAAGSSDGDTAVRWSRTDIQTDWDVRTFTSSSIVADATSTKQNVDVPVYRE